MGWHFPFFRKRNEKIKLYYPVACPEYCEPTEENKVINYQEEDEDYSDEYYWHKEFEALSRHVIGTLKSTCGKFYLPNPTSPYRLTDIEGLHDRLLKLCLIDVPFFCEWGHKGFLKETCPNLRILEVSGADLVSITDDNLELPDKLVILGLVNCGLSVFEIMLPETLQTITLECNYSQKLPMCIEDTIFTRELKVNLSGQT